VRDPDDAILPFRDARTPRSSVASATKVTGLPAQLSHVLQSLFLLDPPSIATYLLVEPGHEVRWRSSPGSVSAGGPYAYEGLRAAACAGILRRLSVE